MSPPPSPVVSTTVASGRATYEDVDITRVPEVFRPRSGSLGLMDWEKVFAAPPSAWTDVDIFEKRSLSRDGVVVVVRPDQYVSAILPLTAHDELAAYFDGLMLEQG